MTAIGAAVRRVEDPPLVMGSARYTEDLALPEAVHVVFVRSVLGHARVTGIDTAEAAAAPGVVAVLTADDLDLEPLRPSFGPAAFARPALAREVVRFMGEAVAVVVASSREQALDAAELVQVDYEPLQVATDPLAALEPDAPVLFSEHGSNVAVERPWKGEPAQVESCEVVVRAHLVNQRVVPAPMEPSAAVPPLIRRRAGSRCGHLSRRRSGRAGRWRRRSSSTPSASASPCPRSAAPSARASSPTPSRWWSRRWRCAWTARSATSRPARRPC